MMVISDGAEGVQLLGPVQRQEVNPGITLAAGRGVKLLGSGGLGLALAPSNGGHLAVTINAGVVEVVVVVVRNDC